MRLDHDGGTGAVGAGRAGRALALLALSACTRASEGAPMVTAPVASAAATATPAATEAGAAIPKASATTPGPASDTSDEVPAAFRACAQDSDCVAVPLASCCHNGWMVAVNVAQKESYAKSFACPQPRPICPMYVVRDVRLPRCEGARHLCVMVDPPAP